MKAVEGSRKRAYSLDEASEQYGISLTTLWRLRKSGELPSVQVGSRVLVLGEDLDAFMEARKTTNGSA